ncbi:MAG: ATP cone domain-containing protein, partial [Gemmatimonadota bacterium]
EGEIIRRRRECLVCKRRYTTYERIEESLPMVVKKDGRREPFDRGKILAGLKKACEKRPISIATLDAVVDRLEKQFQEMGESEIQSVTIGEAVMRELHQLADSVARADAFLFAPRDVYRIESGRGDTLRAGRNPPSGVVIHYSLRTRPDSAVQLEILDSAGTVIKTWSSRSRDSTARIDTTPGTNRFVWNMRYPDASTFPGLIMWGDSVHGPMAPPGSYQVRLTVGRWSRTYPFNLLKDPRVPATQADLAQQFALLIRIRDRVGAANDAVTRIRDLKTQLDGASQRAGALSDSAAIRAIRSSADSLRRRLSSIEEAIYQVRNRSSQDPLNYPIRLNNKLAALGSVVAGGDARPTDQSYAVFEDLSSQLQAQLDRLRAIVETDVPAFNALVRERDVPALIVRTGPRGATR